VNDQPACRHGSLERHVTEVALLAVLLIEHNFLDLIIANPDTAAWRMAAGLIDAHNSGIGAVTAMEAGRRHTL